MRELLFEPAGMTHSSYALDDALARRLAFGHTGGHRAPQQGVRDVLGLVTPLAKVWRKPVRDWSHEDWLKSAAALDPARPTQRVRFQNAASSLVTTAQDYARFLAALMDSAPPAPWRLRDSLRREMLSPLLAVQKDLPLWRGLGWSIERCHGAMRFGHEGNNDGRFTAYVGAEAAAGRGLVILTNDGAGFGLYQHLVREIGGCDQLSFLANADPAVE
jgi:CubicO group peptidase (beta-lactamase class C family)